MGAFILHKQATPFLAQESAKMMRQKGFAEPQKFTLGKYDLYLYNKILVDERNHIHDDGSELYVCGSVVYQGLPYQQSLDRILEDLIMDKLDRKALFGVFCILFTQGDTIQILTDQSGIQNIYHNRDGSIISSSFLVLVEGLPGKLTLNRLSVAETLTTGLQIGPDTPFNEISRYEFASKPAFAGIQWMNEPNDTRKVSFIRGSYHKAVSHQVGVLKKYITGLKAICDEYGADSGITGGHDSRLILTVTKDILKRISFHSHWRKVKDQELACAELVCEKANLPIKVLEVKHPLDATEDEATETFRQGMHYYDGQVRMYCYFYETYNTFSYRTRVLDGSGVGLNGIGGEQYRNDEHMVLPAWNIKRWIKYQLTRYDAGDAFTSDKFENELNQYFYAKISRKLKFENQSFISRLDLKRYLNEVYVPARMGARNNAENQLSFFFSPYSDANVAHEAYKIVPHLGITFDFEESMIKEISPEIAGVMSDYGFDFIKGEPMKRRLQHIVKEFLPFSYKMKLIEKRFLARGNAYSKNLRAKFKVFDESYKMAESLNLPINLDRISYQPDLMGVTFSMGYLLNQYKHKIKFND